jgi:hypothetical protein
VTPRQSFLARHSLGLAIQAVIVGGAFVLGAPWLNTPRIVVTEIASAAGVFVVAIFWVLCAWDLASHVDTLMDTAADSAPAEATPVTVMTTLKCDWRSDTRPCPEVITLPLPAIEAHAAAERRGWTRTRVVRGDRSVWDDRCPSHEAGKWVP